MGTARIDMIIGARDKASPVFSQVRGAASGMVESLKAIGVAAAAYLGAREIIQFARDVMTAFDGAAMAQDELANALSAAGDNSASSVTDIQKFAAELQNASRQEDDATVKLAAYISRLSGMTGGPLQGATQAALGLARATGQSAETMGKAYLNALEGNFTALQKTIPALRNATTEQEKMNIVNALASKGYNQMQSDATTGLGPLVQLKNAWGDFKEVLGGAVAPVIGEIANVLKDLVERYGPMIAEFVSNAISYFRELFIAWWGFISGIGKFLADIFGTLFGDVFTSAGGFVQWFKDLWIEFCINAGFALENWKDLVALGFLQVAKGVVDLKDWFIWVFKDVIPGVVTWFIDNWKDIFKTMWDYTATVFTNLANNIVEIIKNIPALISGEKTFGDLWKPLTDGFESSIKEMPQIAARYESETAKSLGFSIDSIKGELATKYDEYRKARLAAIHSDGKKGPKKEAPKFVAPGMTAKPGEAEKEAKATPDSEKQARAREWQGIAAVGITARFTGLADMFRQQQSPQEAIAENTGLAVKKLDANNRELKGIKKAIEDQDSDSSSGLSLEDL